MTLEEIDGDLTGGLHDASIISLKHDYQNATVTLDIEFDLVDAGYRRGEIQFLKVFYCAMDPPLIESSFLYPGSLCITSWDTMSERLPPELIRALPPGTLHYSIFNRDWYSEIHIAATDCSFRWLSPATPARSRDYKAE
jgi:hypothetical protein